MHFDNATAGLLDQSAIHCIASGEIIAYRIDAKYPTSQYSDGAERQFSTGFVLVKHKLELPSVPVAPVATDAQASTATDAQATEASPSTTTETPREALTFYSLYMHLMDWNSYELPDAPTPPPFMGDTLYSLKPDNATNAFTGLRVRSEPGGSAIAILPKGCKVRTGNAHATSPDWLELLEVIEGRASPALTGTPLGWVYRREMDASGEVDTYLIGEKANDLEPSLLDAKGLSVRKEAKFRSPEMGHLPVGAKIRLEAGTGAYRKLAEVIEGQSVPPHAGNSIHNINGYVHFESLQGEQSKPEVGSVQVLANPRGIEAGELIGHMGQYQNQNDAQPRSLLHLEVFACEDVPAFIEKSREVARRLPADQKTLIKVHAGSSIKQPTAADSQVPADSDVGISADSPKEGRWAKVQPYAAIVKVNKSDVGNYSSATKTYPLNSTQKAALATKAGVAVSELADTVDFLLESYDTNGGSPLAYSGGSIPASHPQRKIGVRLNTATACWVERSQLNAQGQRNSTAGSLQAWTEFPLTNANPGLESGYDYILSGASWADLPATAKAVAPDQTRWWYVTVGGKEGQDISGWVPEIDPIISKHSPWEWPGFTTIEDHSSLVSQCSRNLDATQCITDEEQQTYAAMIEQTERGPIFSKLYDIIDGQNTTGERDGKLTPKEIRTALEKPWLAQSISQIITHHESEWFWNAAKWNALDTLMIEEPGQVNQDWEVEKQRIEKLCWWDSLTDTHNIKPEGKAWSFEPTLTTSIFNVSSIEIITLSMLREVNSTVSDNHHNNILPYLNKYAKIYGLENKREITHFLSQVAHESGLRVLTENLNYSARQMRATYGCRANQYNSTTDDCNLSRLREKLWTHESNYANNPENLANYVYANRMDNGNENSGDGYKYRGRGMIQITGKSEYRSFQSIHNKNNPTDIQDFLENPELIVTSLDYGIESAFAFWFSKKNSEGTHLSTIAKTGTVSAVTQIVNGGQKGYEDRRNRFNKLAKITGTQED